ncbi:hypothetical protein ILUMI_03975 [Ignelater luminosus]|uniref:T-cell activation inhibitor, mitochondrial n=1 Tax=Ignelater luminosus TaxID=2038154 RepID=A0A8K0DAI5_IGNLU|nr:hypothetical protein ILUMI_03975 [Ignelater luminosus]
MLCNIGKWAILQQKFVVFANVRHMTTTEVSTALRPFYFSVHPDLFGQHPNQRSINENSLKQLSSFIESLQSRKAVKPCSLKFYLRDKKNMQNTFRLITIYLNEKDVRTTVLTILKSCDLSTAYVDKIPKAPSPPPPPPKQPFRNAHDENVGFTNINENDPIFGAFVLKRKIKEAKDSFTLKKWLEKNYSGALELSRSHQPLREEIARLQKTIAERLGLVDIRWDCGWNEKHFKGCLQSLQAMTDQNPEPMHVLKGRILVFAPFTGLSLDGHVMLNSGEVRHNWLDLIKNLRKYDQVYHRIPSFEKALSQVLLDIQVVRRKFMPKILAGEYEKNLQQLTTNVSDYLSRRSFPQHWPSSLNQYEIVVETEAGPLMVSPTGQFIAPSSCPGTLLVSFISEHMAEAVQRMGDYKRHKYVERSVHKQCVDELYLSALHKGDNVTPDLMIKCCEKLLHHKHDLQNLKHIHLNITNYYSVLADGTVCIPWNWNL